MAAAAGLRRPVPPGTAADLDVLLADDPDPRVRAAALGALARLPDPPSGSWLRAAADADPAVRRRAADLAPAFAAGHRGIAAGLLLLLGDGEGAVAEAAAWALGEVGPQAVDVGAFEGPAVDAALEAALADRDWQTRQAAEDLLG